MNEQTHETQRLFLRPITTDDAAFLLEVMNAPKWLSYVGDRQVNSVEDAKTYIEERMFPQFKTLGHSNNVIIRKSDQRKVGICGLYDREGLEGLDLGFALLPEYEGRNYAAEAAEAVVTYAFEGLKQLEIKAITDKKNVASQRILTKLGFQRKGTQFIDTDEVFLFAKRSDNA